MSHLKHKTTVVIPHLGGSCLCNWYLQQMPSLLNSIWGPTSTEKGDDRRRKRAGLYLEARHPLEKSPRVVLRQDRASEGTTLPCSPQSKLLSQVNPWGEQKARALTAIHTWTHMPSHETVQKQEKSPMNVKLKKATALMSIFGMNWRILLFQLQPTCWFSSAALLLCSFPFPGLS